VYGYIFGIFQSDERYCSLVIFTRRKSVPIQPPLDAEENESFINAFDQAHLKMYSRDSIGSWNSLCCVLIHPTYPPYLPYIIFHLYHKLYRMDQINYGLQVIAPRTR